MVRATRSHCPAHTHTTFNLFQLIKCTTLPICIFYNRSFNTKTIKKANWMWQEQWIFDHTQFPLYKPLLSPRSTHPPLERDELRIFMILIYLFKFYFCDTCAHALSLSLALYRPIFRSILFCKNLLKLIVTQKFIWNKNTMKTYKHRMNFFHIIQHNCNKSGGK